MRQGFVYFAKPYNDINRVKIGWAVCAVRRIEELSCGSSHPLVMLAFVPSERKGEKFLHTYFADEHRHREWFELSSRLRQTIHMIQFGHRNEESGLERLRAIVSEAENEEYYVSEKELFADAPTIVENACQQCNRMQCPGKIDPSVCEYKERLVRRGSQLYTMKLPKKRPKHHGRQLLV